jgi:hypothetical protein
MFQTKVVEKIKTHILYSIIFSENIAVCEIMWKKCCRAKQATDDNIIRRMRFACWITKATDTHSEYVILIAFTLQQWYANAPQCYVYTYIVCHVVTDTQCVYCAVRTESSSIIRLILSSKHQCAHNHECRLGSNSVHQHGETEENRQEFQPG